MAGEPRPTSSVAPSRSSPAAVSLKASSGPHSWPGHHLDVEVTDLPEAVQRLLGGTDR
jgi:hypothetical protein